MAGGTGDRTGWKKHEGGLRDLLRRFKFPIAHLLAKFSWINNCEILTIPAGKVFMSPDGYQGEVYLILRGSVSLGRRIEKNRVGYLIQEEWIGAGALFPSWFAVFGVLNDFHAAIKPTFTAWTSSELLARVIVLSEAPIFINIPDKFSAKLVKAISNWALVEVDEYGCGVGQITLMGEVYQCHGKVEIEFPPEPVLFGQKESTALLKIPAEYFHDLKDDKEWLNAARLTHHQQLCAMHQWREDEDVQHVIKLFNAAKSHSLLSPDGNVILLGRHRLNMLLYGRFESERSERRRLENELKGLGYTLHNQKTPDFNEGDEMKAVYDFLYCRRGNQKEPVLIAKREEQK